MEDWMHEHHYRARVTKDHRHVYHRTGISTNNSSYTSSTQQSLHQRSKLQGCVWYKTQCIKIHCLKIWCNGKPFHLYCHLMCFPGEVIHQLLASHSLRSFFLREGKLVVLGLTCLQLDSQLQAFEPRLQEPVFLHIKACCQMWRWWGCKTSKTCCNG